MNPFQPIRPCTGIHTPGNRYLHGHECKPIFTEFLDVYVVDWSINGATVQAVINYARHALARFAEIPRQLSIERYFREHLPPILSPLRNTNRTGCHSWRRHWLPTKPRISRLRSSQGDDRSFSCVRVPVPRSFCCVVRECCYIFSILAFAIFWRCFLRAWVQDMCTFTCLGNLLL